VVPSSFYPPQQIPLCLIDSPGFDPQQNFHVKQNGGQVQPLLNFSDHAQPAAGVQSPVERLVNEVLD
jgi:hypothetical protein